MNVIHKYQIPVKEKFELEMPQLSQIIRVEDVDGQCYLWALVDTEKPKETRFFECYKTGQEIQTPITHFFFLGTCKLFIGQELCLYVFENGIKRGQ